MEWAVPKFKRDEVNRAAKYFIKNKLHTDDPAIFGEAFFEDYDNYMKSLEIINNWRSSHAFPLNTFQSTLRKKARSIDPQSIVAQRTKRLSSIFAKLDRFPSMKLSQMQDIGGCRAVMSSVDQVNLLYNTYRKSNLKHKIISVDNYIAIPKPSGYRGIHIIYQYYSDKKVKSYNDLKIEMQLRSSLQHAWATAVETVGTFVQQALKSSQGEEDWLRFFALMGTAIAFKENSVAVPNTPTDRKQLHAELNRYAINLDVKARLRAYQSALKALEPSTTGNSYYFLLELNSKESTVTISAFSANQSELANQKYTEIETKISEKEGAQAVLVSVDSISGLRKAYPNYFLDTTTFIELLDEALYGSLLQQG
jgi:ppGpp synthetase/RelA/SpoT-type nucleotidyltranferase